MGFRLSGSPPCASILVFHCYVMLITANKFLLLLLLLTAFLVVKLSTTDVADLFVCERHMIMYV